MTTRAKVAKQKRIADALMIGGITGAMLCFFAANSLSR
jgi:hypothetical protein